MNDELQEHVLFLEEMIRQGLDNEFTRKHLRIVTELREQVATLRAGFDCGEDLCQWVPGPCLRHVKEQVAAVEGERNEAVNHLRMAVAPKEAGGGVGAVIEDLRSRLRLAEAARDEYLRKLQDREARLGQWETVTDHISPHECAQAAEDAERLVWAFSRKMLWREDMEVGFRPNLWIFGEKRSPLGRGLVPRLTDEARAAIDAARKGGSS